MPGRQHRPRESWITRGGIAALGAAVILMIDGLLAFGLLRDRAYQLDSAVERLEAEARAFEIHTRRSLAAYDELLLALRDRVRMGASPSGLITLMLDLTRHMPQVLGLVVTDGDGAVTVATLDVPVTGGAASPFAIHRDEGAQGLLIGGPMPSEGGEGNRLIIPLSRRVDDGRGRFLGVVALALDLERLTASYGELIDIRYGRMTVALDDGTSLVRVPPGPPELPDAAAVGGEVLTARSYIRDLPDGSRQLVSEQRVTGLPVTISVTEPLEVALKPWLDHRRGAILLGIAATVTIAGLTALLGVQAAGRERALRRLAESEAQTNAIFDQTFQFIALLDLDGRVLRVNDAALLLIGLGPKDGAAVTGHRLHDTPFWTVTRSDGRAVVQAALAAAAEGRTSRHDIRMTGPDGDEVVVDLTVKPVLRPASGAGDEAEILMLLMEGRDITEQHRTRDTLLRQEKAAALGGLVAGIAHEVNTPVGIALTSASHLAKEVADLRRLYDARTLKAADLEEFLSMAEESARLTVGNCERAGHLIQSFKQVAVDQTGGERRRFHLKEYIEEVLLSLRPRLKRTPHTVTVACPDTLELDTDAGALSHVLTNLVMNALLHAFDDGRAGTIRITARRLDGAGGGMVELVFADDGKGIPPDLLARVFDPFFTTKRGAGGSGLGLHIVQTVVTAALAGSLELSSTPGRGTAFILRFPRIHPDSAPESPPQPPAQGAHAAEAAQAPAPLAPA